MAFPVKTTLPGTWTLKSNPDPNTNSLYHLSLLAIFTFPLRCCLIRISNWCHALLAVYYVWLACISFFGWFYFYLVTHASMWLDSDVGWKSPFDESVVSSSCIRLSDINGRPAVGDSRNRRLICVTIWRRGRTCLYDLAIWAEVRSGVHLDIQGSALNWEPGRSSGFLQK